MKLIDLTKSIFNKIFSGISSKKRFPQYISYETSIERILDELEIPDIKYFKEKDEIMYGKIIEYYSIFERNLIQDLEQDLNQDSEQNLSSNNVLYSGEIGNKDYFGRRKILLDLIENNYINGIDNVLNEKNIVKKIIMLKKFEIYLSEIKEIFNDTICRLVALRKIKDNKKLYEKYSLIIDSEINNLNVSRKIIMFRMEAMKGEIAAYQQEIKTLMMDSIRAKAEEVNDRLESEEIDGRLESDEYKGSINNQEVDNQSIEEMFQNLTKNVKGYVGFLDIEESNEDYYTKMAMLEKRLEEFFYSNPDFIKTYYYEIYRINDIILRDKSYFIENGLVGNESKESNPEMKLTPKIVALDEQIKIVEKYGGNKDSELKNDFYRNKLIVIVYENLNNIDTSVFNEFDEEIRKIYREEVERRIDKIVRGNIGFKLDNDKLTDEVKAIKKVFLEAIGNFDADAILANNYFLSLVFALDENDSAGYYLNKWFESEVDTNEFLGEELNEKYLKSDPFFTFDSKLSISSICEVLKGNKKLKNDPSKEAKILLSLIDLYTLIAPKLYPNNYSKENEYYIPEGIVEIRNSNPKKNSEMKYIKENGTSYSLRLMEETKGKYVIMPSSLKAIYDNDVLSPDLIGIEFSNGTERISIFYKDFEEVVIPPTVSSLMIYTFLTESTYFLYKYKSIKGSDEKPKCITRKIIFNDYKKSAFLHPTNESEDRVNRFFQSLMNHMEVILRAPNEKDRIIEINENSRYIDIGNGVYIHGCEKKLSDSENKPRNNKIIPKGNDDGLSFLGEE